MIRVEIRSKLCCRLSDSCIFVGEKIESCVDSLADGVAKVKIEFGSNLSK